MEAVYSSETMRRSQHRTAQYEVTWILIEAMVTNSGKFTRTGHSSQVQIRHIIFCEVCSFLLYTYVTSTVHSWWHRNWLIHTLAMAEKGWDRRCKGMERVTSPSVSPNIPPCVPHTAADVRTLLHILYISMAFLVHVSLYESQTLPSCPRIIHSPDRQTFHLHVGCSG
jgi:hypothetical protein